jgi:hypothetical protein
LCFPSSAVTLRVRVLRRGTQCFMVWNICVSGTILTCLMVGSGLKIPLAGAIFWMYFILVLLFRQLCYVYPYCEKVQNIMKNHEKRRYFLNLESTDFKPGVSEIGNKTGRAEHTREHNRARTLFYLYPTTTTTTHGIFDYNRQPI